jgi:hypothetical protein
MTDSVTPEIAERTFEAMEQITAVSNDLLGVLPQITDRPSIGMFGLLMAAAKIGARLSLPSDKLQEAFLAMYNDAQQHEKELSGEH